MQLHAELLHDVQYVHLFSLLDNFPVFNSGHDNSAALDLMPGSCNSVIISSKSACGAYSCDAPILCRKYFFNRPFVIRETDQMSLEHLLCLFKRHRVLSIGGKVINIVRGEKFLENLDISFVLLVDDFTEKGFILFLNFSLSTEPLQLRLRRLLLAAAEETQNQGKGNDRQILFQVILPNFGGLI